MENIIEFATEEEKSKMTVEDLSYDFAKHIVVLYQFLTEDSSRKEFVMSKQMLRSGTSIGANICEAEEGQSKADFIAKMCISKKEAKETLFWLRLLKDTGYLPIDKAEPVMFDLFRIRKILSSIVKTSTENLHKSNNNQP